MALLCVAMVILFLAGQALAVTHIERYVDGSTGDNENDGTSWAQAWKTLYYAESVVDDYGENADGNYTTTGGTYPDGIRVTVHGRNINESSGLAVDGVTDDATHYLCIDCDGTGALTGANSDVLEIKDDYFRLNGLVVQLTAADGDGDDICYIASIGATSDIRITNCQFIGPDNDSYSCRGIAVNDSSATVTLNNVALYDVGQNVQSHTLYCYAGTVYVYNCTLHNGYTGVYIHPDDAGYAKNTIVSGMASLCYYGGGTLECTNCTGSDSTVDNYDTGSDCHDNVTPTYTGSRYQLAEADSLWNTGGLDLSEDAHWLLDAVDYDGDAQGASWTIGYDKRPSSEMRHRAPKSGGKQVRKAGKQ